MRQPVLATTGATLVLCATLAAAALAASTDFTELATSPELGEHDDPRAIAAADFDGDADQDLAVAYFGGAVTVFANDGAGDFTERDDELTGTGSRSIAVADIDGDSDRDLAVANQDPGSVTVLKNRGNGDFFQTAPSPIVIGGFTTNAVTAADFDSDADPDLAVADGTLSGTVHLLRNHGGGTFAEPDSSPEAVGSIPLALTAADLNNDSEPDLAVTNENSNNVTLLRHIGTLLNFNEPATSPLTGFSFPLAIDAVDVDGDADTDLAVVNRNRNDVSIVRNNGGPADGGFGMSELPSSPEAVGAGPSALASADFDGDGDRDLAVTNAGDDAVTILANGGNGNFTEPATSPEAVGDRPLAIIAAPLDGDADSDLAVGNSAAALLDDEITILGND
jgi:hypothetical protein